MPRQLDLRSGTPVWSRYRAPNVPVDALSADRRCDVLVVGMGISGALIAEALTASGLSVIAIDRRGPIMGSTAATTALVQYEIDQPLSLLSRRIGKDRAVAAWKRSRIAVANLHGRIGRLGIDCRARLCPSLYLAGNLLDADALEAEAAARRAAGLDAVYLPRRALKQRFDMSRPGAILSSGNIALDPRRLAAGCLLLARERGARFFAPVEAVAVEDSADEVAVATKHGPVIRAHHVVLATGYELLDIVPKVPHSIISTWAIATAPQPRRLHAEETLVWEASDPYLYLRQTHDGRIICGGEDEDFTDEDRRNALTAQKAQAISRKLARLLPGVDAVPELAWAGSFGTTPDGLPYIGAIPRHPRLFATLGYGGNGITFSQIASEMIPGLIAGDGDSDAAILGLAR